MCRRVGRAVLWAGSAQEGAGLRNEAATSVCDTALGPAATLPWSCIPLCHLSRLGRLSPRVRGDSSANTVVLSLITLTVIYSTSMFLPNEKMTFYSQ